MHLRRQNLGEHSSRSFVEQLTIRIVMPIIRQVLSNTPWSCPYMESATFQYLGYLALMKPKVEYRRIERNNCGRDQWRSHAATWRRSYDDCSTIATFAEGSDAKGETYYIKQVVAVCVAMADEDPADDAEDRLPLNALPSGRFLHDDDEPFPDDDDDSPPASPPKHKERVRLRIRTLEARSPFSCRWDPAPLLPFPLPAFFDVRGIALFAWGIRQLRSVLARRRQNKALSSRGGRVNVILYRPVEPPLLAHLSPMAVKKLVEINPIPYLLIDVRHPDAARTEPKPFENAINIPETEVRACLQLSAADWKTKFPSAKKPGREDLIIFLSNRGKRAQRVAAAAADLGFNGCCILKGGFQGLRANSSPNGEHVHYISRDAVALLVRNKEAMADDKNVGENTPWLIDLRRQDERALYGHIKGSLHIRVEGWPKALAKDPAPFEKRYHEPKIDTDDIVILHYYTGRSNRRASWAAYVAQDAGFKRCYVYEEGTCGWRLDPTVLPYDSYELVSSLITS
uniref:Rhodanese domain-containing protein n=1 Tax=Physcomitrium patens TaxID=3218 RepID=A0A2K1L7Q8_PHYPA|nr:hypothetical protein PHYPA_000458 [Physcomitrium patens]